MKTKEPRWQVGSRDGWNASQIRALDGEDAMDDSVVCDVAGIPLHTGVKELKSYKDAKDRKNYGGYRQEAYAAYRRALRICEDHNALLGIAEPERAIREAREALAGIAKLCREGSSHNLATRLLELAEKGSAALTPPAAILGEQA